MATTQPNKTLVYKTVGKLQINLDVYLPNGAQNLPVLLWFHGGGCLQGSRRVATPHLTTGVSKHKYILVSADYRLAPQVGISDIFEDVQDAVAFVRDELSKHIGEDTIDSTRLAVSGSSAGGYLALLAGLYVEPKPRVILAIYPITDPRGSFFSQRQPIPFGAKAPELSTIESFLDPNGEVVADNELDSKRQLLYFHMIDNANLPDLLRLKPGDDTFRVAKNILQQRLPPTYVVHGDSDQAVGVEQSDEVVGAMTGLGMEVEYERLHGVNHLFDRDEQYQLERMYKFMAKHV